MSVPTVESYTDTTFAAGGAVQVTMHIQPRDLNAAGIKSSVFLNFKQALDKKIPTGARSGVIPGSFMMGYPTLFNDTLLSTIRGRDDTETVGAIKKKLVFGRYETGGEYRTQHFCLLQLGLSPEAFLAAQKILQVGPLDAGADGEGGIIECTEVAMLIDALPTGYVQDEDNPAVTIITGNPAAIAGKSADGVDVRVRVIDWRNIGDDPFAVDYEAYKTFIGSQTVFGSLARFPMVPIQSRWETEDSMEIMRSIACAEFKSVPLWIMGATDVSLSMIVEDPPE